ncbi:MAG: hypothetical protein EOO24_66390, partial [Comamonadaceae bacterium]
RALLQFGLRRHEVEHHRPRKPHRLQQQRAQRLWDALADGVLRQPAIERFTLDAAGLAHQRLESRQSTGSLVLIP